MKAKLVNVITGIILLLALVSPGVSAAGISPPPAVSNNQTALLETVSHLTLVTGDTVNVITKTDGKRSFGITPANPARLDQEFLTVEQNGKTYILPSGIDLQKLDIELFDIDYLVDEGYDKLASLPLVISYSSSLAAPQVQALEGKIKTLGQETDLNQGVQILSTKVEYSGISTAYESLISQPGVEKIWLDKRLHTELVDSVPLISAPSWWAHGYRGEGQKIAILDTGIDATHPALDDMDDSANTTDPKVVVNVNFTADADFKDYNGHGTHVSGIAAGTVANSTYTGVAPGAKLWNVKVLDRYGSGYESDIINGINYASLGPDGTPGTGDEANIINMSLGGSYQSDGTDPLSRAVDLAVDRGVLVAVAAGNSGYGNMRTIGVPGVARKAFTVGSSSKNDYLSYFSSEGPTVDFRIKPDILAPGEGINSAAPGGGYVSKSGTSMSTPHVAGAAALMRQYLGQIGDSQDPRSIKNRLMITAKDIGLNVYEQGAGRLDLSSAQDAVVLVKPASLSLGAFINEPFASGNLTFYNSDNVSHTVTLSANLTDVINGQNYTGNVSFPPYPNGFNLPPSASVNVTLTVNLTSLAASLYSGTVMASVDNGTAPGIHAIFGFAKVREVTILKTDITGASAAGHAVWVLMVNPLTQMLYSYAQADKSGNFTFKGFDGVYNVVSPNWGHEIGQQVIWTVAENVTISANTVINLDERNTRVVNFDPGKPGMKAAGTASKLNFGGMYTGYGWWATRYFPASFTTRVSPIAQFDAGFGYNYYPEADFLPADPKLVNTRDWHSLLYVVDNITDDMTFFADYSKLVHRDTRYGLALQKARTSWYQYANLYSPQPYFNWNVSFGYDLDAPQQRWEWLSAQPVTWEWYYQGIANNIEWYFDRYGLGYTPGEARFDIGGHPFNPGTHVDYIYWNVPLPSPTPPSPPSPTPPQPSPPPGLTSLEEQWNQVSFYGPITRDSWGTAFSSYYYGGPYYPGHIRVTQNSDNVILEKDISDSSLSAYFQGTPHLTAEVWGVTPFALGGKTYTRLDFTPSMSQYDYRPPQLLVQVLGITPSGHVPSGEVIVKVQATDDSLINNVSLAYAVGDNVSGNWTSAEARPFVDGWYVFSLGQLQETFVGLMVDAEDQYGNHVQSINPRAFYVGLPGVQVRINAPDKVVSGANFTAAVDISKVDLLNAVNYDIGFNPAVLRLVGVTAGQIGVAGNMTAIPVDMWSSNATTGKARIVQNVPGLNGVSGSGYLALLTFDVLGSVGQTSNITLSNGMLSDTQAKMIPAAWVGDFLEVAVIRPGDATGDGLVDARDITKVELIIGHYHPPTVGADANQDGQINALDITEVEIIIIYGS